MGSFVCTHTLQSKVRYISYLGLTPNIAEPHAFKQGVRIMEMTHNNIYLMRTISKRSVYYWASPLPVLIPSKNDVTTQVKVVRGQWSNVKVPHLACKV